VFAQGEEVTISVGKDLAISDFLDLVAKTTGHVVIYDPNGQRIRGQKLGTGFTMNVPKARAFDTFRAILAFFELTLVPIGPTDYKIYLVVDSRSTNNHVKNRAIYVDPEKLDEYADKDGVYIACAVPVRHIRNLTTLRTALSSMVTQAGIGRVHEVPGANFVILVDYAPTVYAMAQLIRQMDVPLGGSQRVYDVIELKHAVAKDLATAINDVLASGSDEAKPPSRGRAYVHGVPAVKPRVVPYAARNALVVSCAQSDLQHIRALVARLDMPAKRLEHAG